jgi:hypothetical protein
MPQFSTFLAAAALAGAAAILPGCSNPTTRPAPPPEPTVVLDEAEFVAVVDSVNQRTRQVVLRGPEGNRVTVTAGPEVRNLAQVRRGDRVVVTYGEALAVELAPPGDTRVPVEAAAGAARARPGQRPAGALGEQVRARVRIEAVDRRTGRVAFVGPQGVRRVVTPREPEMVDFARRLRPGDEVDVTYAEAVAVRVEPASR